MELQREVLQKLREHYGEGKVVSEPSLKGKTTVYPDIAVFHTEEQTTPFLLVECSRFRTAHRRANDFEEISEAVSSTQAEYGALVSQNAEFVFSGNGPAYKSHGGFPEMDSGSATDKRPVQSQAELEFLVERAHTAQNSIRDMPGREEQAIDEFLEYLHLLLEARRQEVPIGVNPNQEVLSKIQHGISERYQCYQQKEDLDLSQLSALSLIFNGYDMSETDDQILEYLFDITSEDKRSGGYSTPLELARQMVNQANLETGDTVLDPAAGRGTVLSLSSAKETSAIGVEINLSVIRLATFYLDLFKRDVELFAGDFFEIANDSNWPSESVDHIIVDPPFNGDIDRDDIPFSEKKRRIYSQDAFLSKGLSLLDQGGSITITVPSGFLHTRRSKWIRQAVLDNFQIDSIIQIIDGPIYQHTSIDTALLKVTKKSPSTDHTVSYEIIESPDEPTVALANAVGRIKQGNSDSILQSELEDSLDLYRLTQQRSIRQRLKQEFTDVVKLSAIADIRGGARPQGVLEEEHEDTIRYLSVKDATGQAPKHEFRYIPREEATVVTTESDVLLSTFGRERITHIPSEPVAPDQHWAVISFDSPEEALVYETFLNSDLGVQQIEALKSGSSISRINVTDLQDFLVPAFSNQYIADRADAIREHQKKIEELEEERKQLERERDQLAGDVNDLLSGGDSDE